MSWTDRCQQGHRFVVGLMRPPAALPYREADLLCVADGLAATAIDLMLMLYQIPSRVTADSSLLKLFVVVDDRVLLPPIL